MTRPSRLPSPLDITPFSHADGLDAGLSPKRLRGRDLQRPFHGVRSTMPLRSVDDRCRAYATRMTPAAFFSSVTAAALWAAPLPPAIEATEPLHVAVPRPGRAMQGRGVRGHSVTLVGGDIRELRSLRVSSPERAWCESSPVLGLHDLVAVGDSLVHSEVASLESLTDFARLYPGRTGRATLLAACAFLDGRAESRPESIVRVILTAAGVRGLVPQHPFVLPTRSGRIDLAIPALRIAIEYMGDYHRDADQWNRDVQRRADLEAAGWRVVEIVARDLANPARILALVNAAIALSAR